MLTINTLSIISKKRDGQIVNADEIKYIIDGFVNGYIPDYQMAAFLMAIYIRGMTVEETYNLTKAMVESGSVLDLSAIHRIKVDKHSTGGVGDKVTLILAPILASLGLKVAKMSGRGLGHTGGTIDKLESIPGFNTNLTMEQFVAQVNDIGLAVMAQTGEICPADKKIYALRDVTATVSSIPLIASSIMSKKIAGGADTILFDVKVGSGAFMKTIDEARNLAKAMIDIAKRFNKQTIAVLSNMDQPLGTTVGNSLEVQEAIDTLKGYGAPDVYELCTTLAAKLLKKVGFAFNEEEAIKKVVDSIESGKALIKFRECVQSQGGNSKCVDEPRSILPRAKFVEDYEATVEGYIRSIDAEKIGEAARILGAGRLTKEDNIDLSAGLVLVKKVGDYVYAGDTLLEMHSNSAPKFIEARKILDLAINMGDLPHKTAPIVYEVIE